MLSMFAGSSANAAPYRSFSAIHIIRSALAYERSLDHSSIDADFEDDFIVLRGSADSFEAIDKAMELARSLTDGPVVNHIQANY